MNTKWILAIIIIIIGALLVNSAAGGIFGDDEDDSIYQVSLLQSFMHGEYEGFVSVGDLKSHGDIGLGTFDGANGEMIFLDGVVYQADSKGNINIMEDGETVPFATVTNFDCDSKMSDISAKDFDDLANQLNKEIEKKGVNQIYVMKIDAECENITVRSVVKQEKPYDEFTEVAARDQKVFNHGNLNGTIVAVYFPEYMDKLNMHGWHLHFLSDNKTVGGHVLNATVKHADAEIDEISEFDMIVPDRDSFNNKDLNENMTDKIKKVE